MRGISITSNDRGRYALPTPVVQNFDDACDKDNQKEWAEYDAVY